MFLLWHEFGNKLFLLLKVTSFVHYNIAEWPQCRFRLQAIDRRNFLISAALHLDNPKRGDKTLGAALLGPLATWGEKVPLGQGVALLSKRQTPVR